MLHVSSRVPNKTRTQELATNSQYYYDIVWLRSIAPFLRKDNGQQPHSSITSFVTLYLVSREQMLCLSVKYTCQPLIHATCMELFCENQNVCITVSLLQGGVCPCCLSRFRVSSPKHKLPVLQSFISWSRSVRDAVSLSKLWILRIIITMLFTKYHRSLVRGRFWSQEKDYFALLYWQ